MVPLEQNEAVEISALLDGAFLRPIHWIVFTLCFVVSMLDGFDIQALSFAAPSLGRALSITPGEMGIVFSGTLAGAVVGSYLGMLADRYGRKTLITISVAIFALFTLGCGLAQSFPMLLVMRVLAGVGLGGAVPNMIAMTSEFAPSRVRSFAVTVILWGFPIGAIAGGLAGAQLIAAYGWRAIFFAGTAAPLLLLIALLAIMPESPRFLALTRPSDRRLATIIRRIAPDAPFASSTRFWLDEAPRDKGRLSALFALDIRPGSILLPLAGFMSLLLFYLVSSWTPALLERSGLSLTNAILGGVILNTGSLLGSLALARYGNARVGLRLIGCSFLCGGAAIWLAATVAASPLFLVTALGAFGFFHMGAQIAVTNYVASYYPTLLRATGSAWVSGVSRLGSLLGPTLGGYLISIGMAGHQLFALGVVPAVLTACPLLWLARLQDRRPPMPEAPGTR